MQKIVGLLKVALVFVIGYAVFYYLGRALMSGVWMVASPYSRIPSRFFYGTGLLLAVAAPSVGSFLTRATGSVSPLWRAALAAFVLSFCYVLMLGGASAGPPFMLMGIATIACVLLTGAVIYSTRRRRLA